ncbi:MAG TPA: sugar transferase [Chthoniobacterales bacterium]|jgi:exopolysaccharide biosynthesis polyprenyl glycosylphosphotransferase
MTGRRQEINLQLNQLSDAGILVLSLWLAHYLRYWATLYFDIYPVPPFRQFLWLVVLIMPFGPLLLETQGYYRNLLQKNLGHALSEVTRAGLWLAVLIAGCVIFFRLEVPSRAVFLGFGVIATILLLVKRAFIVRELRGGREEGKFREKVLLVGVPHDMKQLLDRFGPEQTARIDVVEQIDIEKQPISDLVESLHRHSVGRVLFAGGHVHMNRIEEAIMACEAEGVEAWLLANFIRTSIARPTFDHFGEQPMLVFRTTPDLSWALIVKSMVDVVGAFLGIIVLSPLLLLVALAVRLTSPGVVIFRQMRGGRHGEPFPMYKFRSMYSDAEQRKHELEAMNQMTGPVFKMDADPRITPLGRFLRKYSIDELPQLFNVLRGHMSLVGPRPLPLYEVARFETTSHRRRLSVKPGLTCLWQIAGRNEVTNFHDWVRLDLAYIDNWSLWLDLKILVKTIPAVIMGAGAR